MGTDDIHNKNKRKKIGNFDRQSGNNREKREIFLIVCEGEKQSPIISEHFQ